MESLKFYPARMIRLIGNDKFLESVFNKEANPLPPYRWTLMIPNFRLITLLEKIFNTYVLGDSVMEKKYNEN